MNIKILGSGCARCNQLEKVTKEVLKELGIEATFDHLTEIKQIMSYPILATPGMVIDEELVISGRVPSKVEVMKIITTSLVKAGK